MKSEMVLKGMNKELMPVPALDEIKQNYIPIVYNNNYFKAPD